MGCAHRLRPNFLREQFHGSGANPLDFASCDRSPTKPNAKSAAITVAARHVHVVVVLSQQVLTDLNGARPPWFFVTFRKPWWTSSSPAAVFAVPWLMLHVAGYVIIWHQPLTSCTMLMGESLKFTIHLHQLWFPQKNRSHLMIPGLSLRICCPKKPQGGSPWGMPNHRVFQHRQNSVSKPIPFGPNKWPFQGLKRDLHLGNQKVTLKKLACIWYIIFITTHNLHLVNVQW